MRKPSTIAMLPRTTAWLLAAAVTTSTYWSTAEAQAEAPTSAPESPSGKAPAMPPAAAPTAPPSKIAEPDAATKKAARAAYDAGERAYQAGDYTKALSEFQKANELIPTVHAAYWIGMSLAQSGATADAYDALRALTTHPDKERLGGEKLSAAQAKLDELAKIPGTLVLSTVPPNVAVSVDGQPQPAVEGPHNLELAPGAHRISVTAEGFEARELDVTLRPTEKLEQTVELTALPPPVVAEPPPAPPVAVAPEPAPPPPPREERSKLPAYITLGIAGASAVVGTVFGLQALSAKSDFNATPNQGLADDAERNALIADMAFGVTVTLGITGLVLLLSDEPTEVSSTPKLPQRAKLEVAPYVSPTSGGAAARLTF